MKIMCDTNIILDVLLEREPFVDDSYKVLSLCEKHRIDGFVSASSVTDIYYLVRKYTHSTDLAYKAVGKLLEIVKVCSVTNNDVLTAFQKKQKILKTASWQPVQNPSAVIASSPAIKKTLKNLTFHFSLFQSSCNRFHSSYRAALNNVFRTAPFFLYKKISISIQKL